MKKLLFYIISALVLLNVSYATGYAQKNVTPNHIKIKKVDWRGGELAFHVDDVIQLVRFFQNKDGVKGCASDVSTGNLKITGYQGTKLQKLLLNATVVAELNDLGYNLEVNGQPIILQTKESPLVDFDALDCLDCKEMQKINSDDMSKLNDLMGGESDSGTMTLGFDAIDTSNDLGNLGDNSMLLNDANSSLNLDSLKNAINNNMSGLGDGMNNTLPDMDLTPPNSELNLDSLKRAINGNGLNGDLSDENLKSELSEDNKENK